MILDDLKKQSILNIPKQDDKRRAIAEEVDASNAAGELTYEGLFAQGPEISTIGLEYIDGVGFRAGNAPAYGERPVKTLFPKGVLIAGLRPDHRIKITVRKMVPRYGSSQLVEDKIEEDLGNIAWVPDAYPDRLARMAIWRHGWPHRDISVAGQKSIVDVQWLRQEAAKGPRAVFGAVELWNELLGRPGFAETAGPEFMALVNGSAKKGRGAS